MAYSDAALNAWAISINDIWLDLDGAPASAPYQCHDVFLSYITSPIIGLPLSDGYAPGTEYTDECWRQYPTNRPGLATKFTRYSGTGIKAGDVVFWSSYGGVGGLPHVAVALSGVNAQGQIYCVTQNPGKVKHAWLSVANVLGGFRPITESSPAAPEKKKGLPLMFDIYVTGPTSAKPNTNARLITNYGSFHINNAQLLTLLLRRRNATINAVATGNVQNIGEKMLDAEHDIINSFLRLCFQSAVTGVKFDFSLFTKAMNDGFAKLEKAINFDADVIIDVEDFRDAIELAAPRIGSAMAAEAVRLAGEKLSK